VYKTSGSSGDKILFFKEKLFMPRDDKDYYALAAANEAERKKHLPESEQASCLSCGAKDVGGVLGCRDVYHAITMCHPVPQTYGLGRAIFDTYCLQHLETLCYSAKSYAAHLAFVACWVDYANPLNLLECARVGLNGKLDFMRALEPPSRGHLTILHLQDSLNQADFERRALEWIEDVWQAFAPLHEQARAYLRLFLG
jgi:hypothetical protein